MFEKEKTKNFIKKYMTGILIGLILFSAFAIYTVTKLIAGTTDKIIVLIDGQEQGTYSLGETQSVRIKTDWGYNLLVIENGKAYVAEADCENQVCVHTQPITMHGGQIICLPHRVVIRLNTTEKSEIDAVTN